MPDLFVKCPGHDIYYQEEREKKINDIPHCSIIIDQQENRQDANRHKKIAMDYLLNRIAYRTIIYHISEKPFHNKFKNMKFVSRSFTRPLIPYFAHSLWDKNALEY